jgi:hypothetical protein
MQINVLTEAVPMRERHCVFFGFRHATAFEMRGRHKRSLYKNGKLPVAINSGLAVLRDTFSVRFYLPNAGEYGGQVWWRIHGAMYCVAKARVVSAKWALSHGLTMRLVIFTWYKLGQRPVIGVCPAELPCLCLPKRSSETNLKKN